jgi:beta-mannosidase
MEHHQRSPIGNSTIVHYMLDWFQMPESFEGTVWLSQILQGMAMKYAVEHWRRNMPRTMGTLYWQLNDMWPAPSWASIDWKGNWKALHYMAKRFYAPLLVSGLEHPESGTIDLHITSDLLQKTEGVIRWMVTDARGRILDEGDSAVSIPANANTFVQTLDISRHIATHTTRDVLVWLELDVAGEIVSDNLVVLNRLKHFELPEPTISLAANELDDGRYAVTLLSDAPALYVWLEHPEATFSDNFFHLRPEQEHTVYVSAVDIDALRVKSLVDTF